MPEPSAGEDKNHYISRCTEQLVSSEGKEQKQALAICYSMWKKKNEITNTDLIDKYILQENFQKGDKVTWKAPSKVSNRKILSGIVISGDIKGKIKVMPDEPNTPGGKREAILVPVGKAVNISKAKRTNEAKMGSFPETIERTAYLKDYPEMLVWKLLHPSTADKKRNYNMIDGIAWKELMKLKNKGIVKFYDSAYSVSSIMKLGGEPESYQAEITLLEYDPKPLMQELKRMGFKIK